MKVGPIALGAIFATREIPKVNIFAKALDELGKVRAAKEGGAALLVIGERDEPRTNMIKCLKFHPGCPHIATGILAYYTLAARHLDTLGDDFTGRGDSITFRSGVNYIQDFCKGRIFDRNRMNTLHN